LSERQDWVAWHRGYDDPSSRLSRRLAVVQRRLGEAIDAHAGPIRLISMCAGEGRDVIGVLDGHPRRSEIRARLVEIGPANAAIARAAVVAAALERVEVVEGDAAATDSYAGATPADIILACGVFGNIADADIRGTIAYLPCLAAPDATVIWTRGFERRDRTIVDAIGDWFAEAGFEEVSLDAPEEWRYSVGVHRLVASPRPFEAGITMFTFIR
jgi:hypothetical protein